MCMSMFLCFWTGFLKPNAANFAKTQLFSINSVLKMQKPSSENAKTQFSRNIKSVKSVKRAQKKACFCSSKHVPQKFGGYSGEILIHVHRLILSWYENGKQSYLLLSMEKDKFPLNGGNLCISMLNNKYDRLPFWFQARIGLWHRNFRGWKWP